VNVHPFTTIPCTLDLTFEFHNRTKDPVSGVVSEFFSPLTFPNPYFSYSATTKILAFVWSTLDTAFIGTYNIKLSGSTKYGTSSVSQWINVTINCAMVSVSPAPSDIVD